MASPFDKPPVIPFTVRVGQRLREETQAFIEDKLPSEIEQLLERLAEADPAAQPKPKKPPADPTG